MAGSPSALTHSQWWGGAGIRDLFLAGKKQDLKEGFKGESRSSRQRGSVDGEGILDRGKTSFEGTEV